MGRHDTSSFHIPFSLVVISQKSKVRRFLSPARGFTLIELITAIGILAVLAAALIAVVNPLEQFNKSQDTKRKSDLAQIQRGLEVYYNDHGRYPYVYQAANVNEISEDGSNSSGKLKAWGGTWPPYIDVVPIDPKGAKNYAYWTDSTGQQYILYASLDRGGKDPQSCNAGNACRGSVGAGLGGINITCGVNAAPCTYGVSSPNVSP